MSDKNLDPRIIVGLLFFVSIFVMIVNVEGLILMNVSVLFYTLLMHVYRRVFKTSLILVCLVVLNYYVYYSENQLAKFLGLIVFLCLRFMPVVTLAYLLQKVSTGKLISGFLALRLPQTLAVTLVISLRFFPLMRKELEIISTASSLRGLSFTKPQNWLHPLRSFEVIYVPLMMRTLRISEDLAASSMTKGIDFPYPRTSIYTSRFNLKNMMTALLLVALCMVIVIRSTKMI